MMRPLAPEYIQDLDPYVPGRSIPRLIKLASNENPFGPSPKALKQARQVLQETHLYPVSMREVLKQKICAFHKSYLLTPEQIVLGNGSTELITLLVRTLVAPDETVLTGWPSFLMYRLATKTQGREELSVPLTPSLEYDLPAMAKILQSPKGDTVKIIFLANPNNPTGRHISPSQLHEFLAHVPDQAVLILDEAYAEYASGPDYPDGLALIKQRPRTVVLRTFSKAYGLAGMRIAYAVCDPQIADLLNRVRDPFNVSHPAQAAAMGALDDHEHVRRSVVSNQKELIRMCEKLETLGIQCTESKGNFVLAHFQDAHGIYEGLISHGVIVRPVSNYGLPNSLRITVGKPSENKALFTALDQLVI